MIGNSSVIIVVVSVIVMVVSLVVAVVIVIISVLAIHCDGQGFVIHFRYGRPYFNRSCSAI